MLTQLGLFEVAAPVDAGSLAIAAAGLSHFRQQMRLYGSSWPYLVPEWRGWIVYYERMATEGFDAAESIRPAREESEPSRICAALTRKRAA